jgi:DNA-binding response OmpR family regulator
MGETSLPKILVADDSASDRELLWELFRVYSCVWLEATNGAEALSQVLVEEPDVVILDVRMPELSGWEVCRAIRQHEGLSGVRVLMLTSMGTRVNATTSPLFGADGYLDKPFDIDVMRSMVSTLVERNGRQLRLQSDP